MVGRTGYHSGAMSRFSTRSSVAKEKYPYKSHLPRSPIRGLPKFSEYFSCFFAISSEPAELIYGRWPGGWGGLVGGNAKLGGALCVYRFWILRCFSTPGGLLSWRPLLQPWCKGNTWENRVQVSKFVPRFLNYNANWLRSKCFFRIAPV